MKIFLKIFKENMDSQIYKQVILEFFVPFIAANYDFSCKLHQDNDSKHTSAICSQALIDKNINWVIR